MTEREAQQIADLSIMVRRLVLAIRRHVEDPHRDLTLANDYLKWLKQNDLAGSPLRKSSVQDEDTVEYWKAYSESQQHSFDVMMVELRVARAELAKRDKANDQLFEQGQKMFTERNKLMEEVSSLRVLLNYEYSGRPAPLNTLVPMTEDEIDMLWRKTLVESQQAICRVTRTGKRFARAIEAFHSIGAKP